MFNISPPLNQSQLTGFITSIASQTSNVTSTIVGSSKNVNGAYKIWTQLCVPQNLQSISVVEFMFHGCVCSFRP